MKWKNSHFVVFAVAVVCVFGSGVVCLRSRGKQRTPPRDPILLDVLLLESEKWIDGEEISLCCYIDLGGGIPSLSPVPFRLRDKVSVDRYVLARFSDEYHDRFSRHDLYLSSFANKLVIVDGIYHRSGYQEDGRLLSNTSYVLVEDVRMVSSEEFQ